MQLIKNWQSEPSEPQLFLRSVEDCTMQRRDFLTICSVWFAWPVLANTRLPMTPTQAEGPFYPLNTIPVRSNLILNQSSLIGKTLELSGHVKTPEGTPMKQVRVEIWQCDGAGVYDHPRQPGVEQFDRNFAGSGATESNEEGRFNFTTLYPVPYTGRPPHIHVKLWLGNRELLITQLYLQGQTGNEWWGGNERELLQLEIKDAKGSAHAHFDFIVASLS